MKFKILLFMTSLLLTNNYMFPVKTRNLCTRDHERLLQETRLLQDLRSMIIEDRKAQTIREEEIYKQKIQELKEKNQMIQKIIKKVHELRERRALRKEDQEARLNRTREFANRIFNINPRRCPYHHSIYKLDPNGRFVFE